MQGNTKPSTLVHTMARLSKCVGAIGTFYLAPYIAQQYRLEMEHYLADAFGHVAAFYGSWVFVGVVVLTAFFAIATFLHLFLHAFIRFFARRSVF